MPFVTVAFSVLSKPKHPSFLREIPASIISTQTSRFSFRVNPNPSDFIEKLIHRKAYCILRVYFLKPIIFHNSLYLFKFLASYYKPVTHTLRYSSSVGFGKTEIKLQTPYWLSSIYGFIYVLCVGWVHINMFS